LSRLIGYIGSQADRLTCALTRHRGALARDGLASDGWGVGFYQGDEVLLRRRPRDPRVGLSFLDLTKEIQTDVLVGHIRSATVGEARQENTHPFRFRSWIFAHQGTVGRFPAVRARLLESVPDFLRRNVRGETDSEHFFHLFLAFLHDAGRLEDPGVGVTAAMDALRTSLGLLDRLVAEVGGERSTMNAVATNGRILLALRRGPAMRYLRLEGLRDCEICRIPPERSDRSPRPVDHEALRYAMVASDVSDRPGWTELPDGSVLGLRRDLQAVVNPL